MLWRRFFPIVSVVLALHVAGCASIVTKKADPNDNPHGIRIYPPRVYLFVFMVGDTKKSKLTYLPDYGHAYDIKPRTFLAKQDTTVEFGDGGQVSKLTVNQDTTAIIDLIKRGAELGAKAAGVPVAAEEVPGSLGLAPGIYRLEDDGTWVRVAGGASQ